MTQGFKSMKPHHYIAGGKKANTAKPRSRAKIERMIAGLERHIEQNPYDDEARKRLTNAKQRLRAL